MSSIIFFTRPIQNFPDFYKPVGPGNLEILRNKQTISKYFSAIYDIYVFKYICKITAIYDIYICKIRMRKLFIMKIIYFSLSQIFIILYNLRIYLFLLYNNEIFRPGRLYHITCFERIFSCVFSYFKPLQGIIP